MVRKTSRRGLIALAIGLAGSALAAAPAQAFCGLVTIPEELGLACNVRQAEGPMQAVIEPGDGTFSGLSRMTIRKLEEAERIDLEPAGWLESQMTIDMGSFVDRFHDLAQSPDSPIGGPAAQTTIAGLRTMLDHLGALALAGCEQPFASGEDRWDMACAYQAAGFGMFVDLRLVISDDAHYAIMMQTMNPQRLRHFEAIANSFQAPDS